MANISSCVGPSRWSAPRRSLSRKIFAVLGPPAARLVRLPWQQRRNDTSCAPMAAISPRTTVTDRDQLAERQQCRTRRGAADVAGADEQPVTRHLGVRRVLAEGPKEEVEDRRRTVLMAARLRAPFAARRRGLSAARDLERGPDHRPTAPAAAASVAALKPRAFGLVLRDPLGVHRHVHVAGEHRDQQQGARPARRTTGGRDGEPGGARAAPATPLTEDHLAVPRHPRLASAARRHSG